MDVTKWKNFANKPLSPDVQTARLYCTRYATTTPPNQQQIYAKMVQKDLVVSPNQLSHVQTTFQNFLSNTMGIHYLHQFIPVNNNNMNDFQNLSVMKSDGCQPISSIESKVNVNSLGNMIKAVSTSQDTASPGKKTGKNETHEFGRHKSTKSPNKMYYRNLIEELSVDKRNHCKTHIDEKPSSTSENNHQTTTITTPYEINPLNNSYCNYELIFEPAKRQIPRKFKDANKNVKREEKIVSTDESSDDSFICVPNDIELYSSPFSSSCSSKSDSDDKFVMLDSNSLAKPEVNRRIRTWSDCESEDSFIVFDGDVDLDSDQCDEQSSVCSTIDADSDSEYDEVDCCTLRDIDDIKKKVQFKTNSQLCVVHPMVQWRYAYQTARKGPWEEVARDRGRFHSRIRQCNDIISPILKKNHRDRIYQERFDQE